MHKAKSNIQNRFNFSGGVQKYPDTRQTSKFLLFNVLPNTSNKTEEKILFQSLKEGWVVDTGRFSDKPITESSMDRYQTKYPFLKIFSLVEKFGSQKSFYSFYFLLDQHEELLAILPLCDQSQDWSFMARGRLMRREEVKNLLQEDSVSYQFFQKQAPLPRSVLNRIIIKGQGEAGVTPATSKVRMLRL